MSTNCENNYENFYNVSSTTMYTLCHNLIIVSTVIGELSNEPISFFSAIYSRTCQVVAKIVKQKLFSQIFSKFYAFRLVEYPIFFTRPKPPPDASTCPWCLHWWVGVWHGLKKTSFFNYLTYFYYYSWVSLHFLILFMGLTVLF